MPRHTDIPSLVYHNLRAIHESRLRRLDPDSAPHHFTNQQIFALMPDCQQINWRRGEQEALMIRTLSAMHTEALLQGLR